MGKNGKKQRWANGTAARRKHDCSSDTLLCDDRCTTTCLFCGEEARRRGPHFTNDGACKERLRQKKGPGAVATKQATTVAALMRSVASDLRGFATDGKIDGRDFDVATTLRNVRKLKRAVLRQDRILRELVAMAGRGELSMLDEDARETRDWFGAMLRVDGGKRG